MAIGGALSFIFVRAPRSVGVKGIPKKDRHQMHREDER